jgi:hypothetical protein
VFIPTAVRNSPCAARVSSLSSCASSVLLNTSVHRRGERNARQKVICVFHVMFTFPHQKSRLNLNRIFAPLPLQRPQKQKMSKTNCDRYRSVPALPSFLFLVCGNDFTRPTGDIDVNCPLYTKRPPETKTSTKIFVICHFSFGDYSEAPSRSFMGANRRSYIKRGGCSAICRLSGRIAVTLVSFRKRMAPSRQCNGAKGGK